jgi:succinyl-CoA synthetase beta subunit
MRLPEYQSKAIMKQYGIPIPSSKIATMSSHAKQLAEELGGQVVIKSQVLVSGRGKAGGIRVVKDAEEADVITTEMLGMTIKDLPVRKVLVEELVRFDRELYLGITYDCTECKPVMLASTEGGEALEEIVKKSPETVIRIYIDPLIGLLDYQARDAAVTIGLPNELVRSFSKIAHGLWQVYRDCDAVLTEINPLVITREGNLMTLDAKIILDDDALFRHPDLSDLRDFDVEDIDEVTARKYGFSYIKLSGNIGSLVNGAGLSMATMDLIEYHGGSPANFFDVGGNPTIDNIIEGLKILLKNKQLDSLLINIFSPILDCKNIAEVLLNFLLTRKNVPPIVVRLAGKNAHSGLEILENSIIISQTNSLNEAAMKVVELAKASL